MKNLLVKKQVKQKGFTLTEVLIVVGIIALGFLGIAQLAKQAGSDNKAADASRNAVMLAQNSINLYKHMPDFGAGASALSETALIDNSKVPESMVSGATIVNPWGGTVVVAGANTASGSPAVQLTYSSVNTDECASFSNAVAGQFDEIDIAGTIIKAENGLLDPVAMGTQCASGNLLTVTLRKNKI
jgi:prepilin-type N-terminal cleavage/methylation domain-containing protein